MIPSAANSWWIRCMFSAVPRHSGTIGTGVSSIARPSRRRPSLTARTFWANLSRSSGRVRAICQRLGGSGGHGNRRGAGALVVVRRGPDPVQQAVVQRQDAAEAAQRLAERGGKEESLAVERGGQSEVFERSPAGGARTPTPWASSTSSAAPG